MSLYSTIEPRALDVPIQMPKPDSQNKSLNKLFSQAREEAAITSNL